VREVTDRLDHQYLNDLVPFNELNPTAEHIALHIFQALAERLNDGNVRVHAVTVWETDRASARYSED
jgi:6-pyruvoyltetrahydropterin/6-carboxytetrahydropterin synthase